MTRGGKSLSSYVLHRQLSIDRVSEDVGRTYPFQVYFKAIKDDKEDRFERLDYTLPRVRHVWNEDGTRVTGH